MPTDDIEKLRKVNLFSKMDDAQLAAVRAMMAENQFVQGQVVIREGEPGDSFHVITAGTAQFLTQDASGKELVLGDAGPSGIFGELSMLTGHPRSARVRAATPVTTLSLQRKDFLEFLATHAHAAVDVLSVLSERLHGMDKMLRQSVSKNPNQIAEERMTLGQRIADGFASTMGSWSFIIIQSAILVFWILYNSLAPRLGWIPFDEYPFIFLNLALSFQAAYAAPIIMMSQNRQSEKDRLDVEIDHDVNVKAEIKVDLILRRLDDLEKGLHQQHHAQMDLLKGRPA